MELVIENLTKEFNGFKAVDHVSLRMEKGIYGLLGVNGAGKTTLMRMLCTLIHPTGGSITCNGTDIFEMGAAYRALLGYLPQDFGFYPDFTVTDYLRYIASIKGLSPAAAKKRVGRVLQEVGMEQSRSLKMKKLSGGMKRRVGIAQAILNDPKILILDEPTAGLDPGERIRFRNLISELSQDRLVLLSTHIVSDIESAAGRVYLMKEGRIGLSGTVPELLGSAPVKAWTCCVMPEEADRLQDHFLVSNRRALENAAELRIVSGKKPAADATEEKLTLEDLFLYVFGEKAGEMNG